MKMLKKLALVSAISAISVSAFAMEAMDDEAMATTTGQDGITINIVPDVIKNADAVAMKVTEKTMREISLPGANFKGLSIGEIRVHDDDGLGASTATGSGTGNSGALVIGGGISGGLTAAEDRTVILARGDKPIQINIDMVGDSDGAGSAGGAMLNVEIKQPKLAIKLGNIYVANSNAAEAGRSATGVTTAGSVEVDGTTVDGKVKIMDGLEIVMNESTMTIQLGNEAQGSMIKADATLAGGLTINSFALYDQQGSAALTADDLFSGTVGRGGSFRASSIKITDTGASDLTAKTSIDFGSRLSNTSLNATNQTTRNSDVIGGVIAKGAPYSTVMSTYSLTAASTVAQVDTAATNATAARVTAQDTVVDTVSGNTYTTYAAAVTAANGVDGISGTIDDNATAAGYVAAADGNATVINAKSAETLVLGVQTAVKAYATATTTTGTWGGQDTYNGLVITSELGATSAGIDIAINNAVVGDTNASVIGDVQIIGLALGKSKIVIMGH